jgi:hypothetical protein
MYQQGNIIIGDKEYETKYKMECTIVFLSNN